MTDGFIRLYNENCASCHGEDLRGLTRGPALVGRDLKFGNSTEAIAAIIGNGVPGTEMPGFRDSLRENKIWNLALYVAEQRQGTTILDKNDKIEVVLPAGPVSSERHDFIVETVAEGLDAMPFGIAPLPDGRILLTERMYGLRIVNTDGSLSDYIEGTPPVYDDAGSFLGQVQGLGWMLDVAIHPDYAENGWIYLHHTDRCSDCNDLSRRSGGPVSMNRIVRGRIARRQLGRRGSHLGSRHRELFQHLRPGGRRPPRVRCRQPPVLHRRHQGFAGYLRHSGQEPALRQGAPRA